MAKKRSGPGDEDADFAALDKSLLPFDDSVLNDVFARLNDFSALDDILRLDDSVLNELFAWLDDFSALGDILRLDDSALNELFAWSDDFSSLDDILHAEDNVLDEIFGRLDGTQNPTTRHAAAKSRLRGRGRHSEGHAARVGGKRSTGEILASPKRGARDSASSNKRAR